MRRNARPTERTSAIIGLEVEVFGLASLASGSPDWSFARQPLRDPRRLRSGGQGSRWQLAIRPFFVDNSRFVRLELFPSSA
jgi:hypothetical protein